MSRPIGGLPPGLFWRTVYLTIYCGTTLITTVVLERQMAALDEQRGQATEAFAPQLEPRQSLPGIKSITARDIIAEMGADRSRLGSAKRLSSWAGMSPGNNESAGKRRKGRTRQGHRSLRRV